jgi:predicted HTH domain antitoxin
VTKDKPAMPNRIVIDVPANVALPNLDHEQVLMRHAVAIVLYKEGKLTMPQARGLMGASRREFEAGLARYGFAMMDEDQTGAELDAAKRLLS